MSTHKIILSSFLIIISWFIFFVSLETALIIFLKILSYRHLPYRGDLFKNIVSHIFLISPFIIAVFVASYLFLKTKRKYFSFFSGCFTNIVILYVSIFLFADDLFYGAASAGAKDVALFISPFVIIISLILLLFNQKSIYKNDGENFKKSVFNIAKILIIFYTIRLTYLFYNTLIIFFATSTGWTSVCNLNSGRFPIAMQPHRSSFHYPDTCLVEMGKKGYDACSAIDYERYRNNCYLELSLYTGDSSLCEEIGLNPPRYYMDCVFRKKTAGHHPAARCQYSRSRIEDYGEDISMKDCIQKKYEEAKIDWKDNF
jgi:hypothetical protein